VELGRIDLTFGVSLMSRFSGAPREDHMQKILWMFTYIKRHLESKLVFDPFARDWSHYQFLNHDWSEFYPDAMEAIPSNAPEARGKPVQINMFCDAAHANDMLPVVPQQVLLYSFKGPQSYGIPRGKIQLNLPRSDPNLLH
jgi:hypothetical protein